MRDALQAPFENSSVPGIKPECGICPAAHYAKALEDNWKRQTEKHQAAEKERQALERLALAAQRFRDSGDPTNHQALWYAVEEWEASR